MSRARDCLQDGLLVVVSNRQRWRAKVSYIYPEPGSDRNIRRGTFSEPVTVFAGRVRAFFLFLAVRIEKLEITCASLSKQRDKGIRAQQRAAKSMGLQRLACNAVDAKSFPPLIRESLARKYLVHGGAE